MLAPSAPHTAEEMGNAGNGGHDGIVAFEFNAGVGRRKPVIPVQVNGRCAPCHRAVDIGEEEPQRIATRRPRSAGVRGQDHQAGRGRCGAPPCRWLRRGSG